ncbi:MAG: hypothetical protein GSR86_04375 [Desulfurococcales archaeon]|nr:hypothetical protein [Desulfurococcales archaeon]
MNITMIIHPTCATSYTIVKHLHSKGLLEKVELLSASDMGIVFKHRVWSVPWIMVNGEPVATDPVEPGEVEGIIEGSGIEPPRDPTLRFMETVLHSAHASSLALLWGSLDPVMDEDLIKAALRSPLTGYTAKDLDPSRIDYDEWMDKFGRALAISFVRELWWAAEGNPPQEPPPMDELRVYVRHWLISKASLGRAGIPLNPLKNDYSRIDSMARFLGASYKALLRRVKREQEAILSDELYWRILEDRL